MKDSKLWAIVTVERGFPSSITFHKSETAAYTDQESLNARINPDYDEAEMFEINLEDLIRKDRLEIRV